MAQIDGGQALVATLKRFGVDTIFTLHGGHLDCVYQAAVAEGFRIIDHRHEQAAGIAATGYARTTGKVGVAMVTAGGGITNVVTAVANAYSDCVASVFLGGAPPLRDFDALPVNSGYDQLSVMGGITKWSHRVTHVERLPDLLGRAFHIAREGRPGPVYLDLPSDVLFALVEEGDVAYPDGKARVSRPAPSTAAVADALELLRSAERPVILAGGGVAYSGGGRLLTRFADLSGIPVATNNKSRGALATDNPLWVRGFGTLGAAAARGAGQPDVVLLLGARLGLYTGGRRKSVIPADAKIIQVDIAAEEIGRVRGVELGIVSDCREMLEALIAQAGNGPWPDRREWLAGLRGDHAPRPPAQSPGEGLTPALLASTLASAAPDDAIFVLDGGETPAWFDGFAASSKPDRWLGHGYMGIMGEGMPLAVGAQVAHPDKRVICFSGDGAVGFNFAEFDTMVRHNLPVVVVVNNDQQWGMSAHGQDLIYGPGKRVASDLAATRYDLAAAGFGAHPEYVTSFEELGPALKRALAANRPACINVMTKPVMNPITQRFMGLAAQGLRSPEGKARVPYADVLEV
ncbi:thiamine pyrophosphate-binding protein [Bradyrhizobium neotropicale]|uniref:thiamine pyrophosphate-binding protein n=1 Tax=Bradyrhizobium neotropicale TaxID=1497615 RepID=UPI001AD67B91|nr:thiamine pyrophosphate-binding protein [Bradyrhizobium neotropicale]MBO4224103.1 thiamine pyrophosphate-binding protein [Bradyrhizobium neotropicale]